MVQGLTRRGLSPTAGAAATTTTAVLSDIAIDAWRGRPAASAERGEPSEHRHTTATAQAVRARATTGAIDPTVPAHVDEAGTANPGQIEVDLHVTAPTATLSAETNG